MRGKNRFVDGRFNLDLSYITPRVIAMGCPRGSGGGRDKNDLGETDAMLTSYHGAGHVQVWDLTLDSSYDAQRLVQGNVVRRGFADHHAPPLALLWAIMREMSDWLQADPHNVVCCHCLAGRGRTGTVLSAWLLCSGECTSADAALAYFAAKRGAAVRAGSQRRYVHYVARQLAEARSLHLGVCSVSSRSRSNNALLLAAPTPRSVVLAEVRLHGCPECLTYLSAELVTLAYPHEPLANGRVFVTAEAPHTAHASTTLCIPVGVAVAGDVQLRISEPRGRHRVYLFRVAFHTHFLQPQRSGSAGATTTALEMTLQRAELDGAFTGGFYDTRFAKNFQVVLVFLDNVRPKL